MKNRFQVIRRDANPPVHHPNLYLIGQEFRHHGNRRSVRRISNRVANQVRHHLRDALRVGWHRWRLPLQREVDLTVDIERPQAAHGVRNHRIEIDRRP